MLIRHHHTHSTNPHVLPLTILAVVLSLLTPNIPSAQAKTLYVQPSSEVVVRRGQGTDYKIIAMVKNGTSVELLEETKDYSRVRLPNNKEGWMLTRFLNKQPPLKEVVNTLRNQTEKLKQSRDEALEKFNAIVATLSTTEKELQVIISERDQALTDFQELREQTADTIKIQEQQRKTASENKVLIEKINVVERRSQTLEKDSTIKWFLAGGSVLLLGMLIGASANRSRRKKSSFY